MEILKIKSTFQTKWGFNLLKTKKGIYFEFNIGKLGWIISL